MSEGDDQGLPPRRHALVTGGSRGIGRAVVEMLAASGMSVVATARSVEALQPLIADADGHGWPVRTAVCDVTDELAVTELFEREGPFDVVVPNAGISRSAPLHRTSTDDLRAHLEVNTIGAFLTLRAALPDMRANGWGRVVVVASIAGLRGASYITAYAASKHAVVGIVRTAGAEVAGTGVTVNAVCPAYVDTDMTHDGARYIAEKTGLSAEEAEAAMVAQQPLGRLITAEEVAAAVTYLAGDLAAPVNGQTLVLDGGAA